VGGLERVEESMGEVGYDGDGRRKREKKEHARNGAQI
jgi:hypothetical protein